VILEGQRTHLRAVAYRLLGSVHEADDAVQEAWLRLERSDVSEVDNLSAWLTTVVSRICLDQLRSRASRREALGVEPDEAVDRTPCRLRIHTQQFGDNCNTYRRYSPHNCAGVSLFT
jgi:DNA-directed RNA polymerase specialized sigma24 family protein